MRRKLPFTALVLVCLVTSAAPAQSRRNLDRIDLQDGDTLVFLGDSITHQCLYTQYVEDYFYCRFPNRRIRFHNSGVGGDRATDCLIRFERDVAHYKPKYVTVLIGMNDGSYRPYDEETFQTYRRDMLQLIESIKESGAEPILMHPTMFDSLPARKRENRRPPAATLELYNSVLAYYGAWLREQALQSGLRYVDMYSPLNSFTLQARRADPEFTMIPDSVHPGPAGQLVMAFAILRDLNAPRQLWRITVTRDADGKADAEVRGGKLADARFTSDGLDFTFTARGLPMPVLDEARVGAELANLPHRLGQQDLEVHGLAPGDYQLLIDDQAVGTYTAAELARHVPMESNAKTPDYQQAQQVAMLNKRRNDEAVHPLRNLWRDKKVLRYTRARLENDPDNDNLKKRAASLEERLANFEDQITELEAKAKTIEEEIYQINQPQAHRYRLVRVE
jgi:lysophospholipase L1-like esterase